VGVDLLPTVVDSSLTFCRRLCWMTMTNDD
jgi:hypothetical protein